MNNVVEIILTNGQVALIDSNDQPIVNGYRWRLGGRGYVAVERQRKTILMHRLIVAAQIGQFVDHVNGNRLDNRRANLRLCTRSENNWNRPTWSRHGFKGIVTSWNRKRFSAVVYKDGEIIARSAWLPTVIDAARAYDGLAKEICGEFAQLNFPD